MKLQRHIESAQIQHFPNENLLNLLPLLNTFYLLLNLKVLKFTISQQENWQKI